MSHCRYCDKVVLLRDAHPGCEGKYQQGQRETRRLIRDAIITGKDLGISRSQAEHVSRASFVPPAECNVLIAQGWDDALDQALADGRLEPYKMQRLKAAADGLGIDPELLKLMGVEVKLLAFRQQEQARQIEQQREQALVRNCQQTIEALRRGEFPRYPYATPPLPFLFGQDQWLLWLFEGVNYRLEKKRHKSVRQSQGLSYHGAYAGVSESTTVEWSEMVDMGDGVVALTSKCFYYAGSSQSLKIPYNKIVTVRSHSDGIEVIKDGAAATRQVFQHLDGAFAHNLLSAIAGQGR